jgi:hypothetical protein
VTLTRGQGSSNVQPSRTLWHGRWQPHSSVTAAVRPLRPSLWHTLIQCQRQQKQQLLPLHCDVYWRDWAKWSLQSVFSYDLHCIQTALCGLKQKEREPLIVPAVRFNDTSNDGADNRHLCTAGTPCLLIQFFPLTQCLTGWNADSQPHCWIQSVGRRCYSTGGKRKWSFGHKFWKILAEGTRECRLWHGSTTVSVCGNSHVQGMAANCQYFELLLMLVTGRLCWRIWYGSWHQQTHVSVWKCVGYTGLGRVSQTQHDYFDRYVHYLVSSPPSFISYTVTAPWDMELVKYTQFHIQAYPRAFENISIICWNNKYIIIDMETIEQLK